MQACCGNFAPVQLVRCVWRGLHLMVWHKYGLTWVPAPAAFLDLCSRTFINDVPVAFDPERAMAELVLHTHYLPRHWRGRAHSAEVQQSVNSMFTFKVGCNGDDSQACHCC